ncbi:MAG: porin family protein [Methylococcaceae bacterium]|nr:porin family protein [Methylococcaceae bacterium]
MFTLLKSNLFILIGILATAQALAEESKAYVQINAGAAFAQPFSESFEQCFSLFGCNAFSYKEKTDTGFAASVALGYRLTDYFRLEGEGMYQSNDLNHFTATRTFGGTTSNFSGSIKGERERTAFLLNAYYDFKNSTSFTPYLTAGAGGYHLRIKSSRFNPRPSRENDLDFAWQVGAGVNYQLNDRISFDLKYRYFSGTNAEVTIPASNPFSRDITELYDVGDHQVMAGIRVGF